jgi:hypothetical protein
MLFLNMVCLTVALPPLSVMKTRLTDYITNAELMAGGSEEERHITPSAGGKRYRWGEGETSTLTVTRASLVTSILFHRLH